MEVVVDRPRRTSGPTWRTGSRRCCALVRGDLLDPGVVRIDAVDNFDVYGCFGVVGGPRWRNSPASRHDRDDTVGRRLANELRAGFYRHP